MENTFVQADLFEEDRIKKTVNLNSQQNILAVLKPSSFKDI